VSGPVGLPPALLPLLLAADGADTSDPTALLGGSPDLLAALAALGGDATLSGTVAATDNGAGLQLLTALGTFTIETELPLPTGAQIVLQLAGGRPYTATIRSIDDVSTTGAAAPPVIAAAPDETPPAALPPPALIAFGTTVRATVVPLPPETLASAPTEILPEAAAAPEMPAEPAASAATAAATSPAATDPAPILKPTSAFAALKDLAGRAVAAALGASPAAAAAATAEEPVTTQLGPVEATPPITVPQAATAPAATSAALARHAPNPPLAIGSSFGLRILGVQLPPPPGNAAATPVFLATIERKALGGAIIATPAGALRIAPAPPLAAGDTVELRLLPGTPASALLTPVRSRDTGAAPPQSVADAAPRDLTSPLQPPIGSSRSIASAPAFRPGPPGAVAAPLLVRVLPDAVPHPAERAAAAAPFLVGTVLAERAALPQATLIETPLGPLALAPRLALPPDTLLLLDPLDAAGPLLPPLPAEPHGIGTAWSALPTALAAIGAAAPDLASHLRADLSATAGDRLAAAFLLIVASLRGDAPPWPGAVIERTLALSGHDEIRNGLAADFTALRDLAATPATAPWQVFILPLFDANALKPVRLYLKRRDGERRRRGGDAESQRFILEFELSRMGALQLDGFIRPKRFDLVLRSQAPLAPSLRHEVTRIFHDRVMAAGIGGDIEFATVTRFEVAPLDALREKVGLAV
jgi:hypothetical protein